MTCICRNKVGEKCYIPLASKLIFALREMWEGIESKLVSKILLNYKLACQLDVPTFKKSAFGLITPPPPLLRIDQV